MKAKGLPTGNTTAKLQRYAQERADTQSRRIPWRRLEDTRKQYIDWQEFCLWVRAILEAEGGMPEWLSTIVEERCPGWLHADEKSSAQPLGLRLEDWIDGHIFGFVRNEGWLNAVVFYAVRDPRYQRAEVCWSECVEKWRQARPIRYPSFEEWQAIASACDETAHLVPEQREAQASARRVSRERLEEAISQYIDWEALAYWARPALEHGLPLPGEVNQELERLCPGFLARAADTGRVRVQSMLQDLMIWIGERFFANAKAERWFDAILAGVQRHPRAIRTMEYADHCEETRGPDLPAPYPSFDDWRREADSYIESQTD